MTLFEGVALVNLLISLVLAYKLGKVQNDIDVLYEGIALTMEKTDLST